MMHRVRTRALILAVESSDRPWKGRNAAVKDAFGNIWYMETYKG